MSRSIRHILLIVWIVALCSPAMVRAQQTATEVIRDIKSAYENLDLNVAEARIEAALENFDRFSPVQLSEIYTISALVHFSRGDQERTIEQLDLALQIYPGLVLNTRETPPRVLALLDELQTARSSLQEPEEELRYIILHDPRPAAVIRSMLVPGWGQLYKKQQRKGIVLMSAWGTTAVGTLVAHAKRNNAEDFYLDATNLAEVNDRYPAFNRWHKARNNLFLAASAIWVYSYVDALLQNPAPPASGLQFQVMPNPAGTELSLTLSF